MLTVRFQSNAIVAALAFALSFMLTTGALARGTDDPSTGAGTLITNHAQATYQDDSGTSFATVSPTISVTVLAVSALVVTPDETQPSASVAPRERVTRVFQICNTGNTADSYTLTRAEISAPASVHEFYFDADNNGVVSAPPDTLARLNETASPQVAPGACLNVLTVVDTGDVAPQSTLTINLTARSNNTTGVNGMAEDAGTITNAVGNSARLTDPNNTSLPPSKLVENRDRTTAATGQTLNYSISFRNSGGTPARQVLVSDELPAGLEYVAGTLQLAGRTLSDAADADEGAVVGRRIEVRLAQVAVDQLIQINYQARITDQMPSGAAIINTANLSGENFTATNTSDAVVVVDPFGVVYAGHSGGAVRIGDARVSLLTDQAGNPLQLPPDVGFAPNEPNVNPFSTDGQGRFAFALTPAQLGTPN
ncbi:MAG: isopeptide-forming domain-containing fimbrial protein, partial [Acidobacteriota bacterium]|nr:isopeptide-forming domain-containing fimbrial protein [Acidobacteriota bacterium]